MALDFPNIHPVALDLGHLSLGSLSIPIILRWYALAYIAGLLGGIFFYLTSLRNLLYGSRSVPLMTSEQVEDLFLWCALGVIFGGRLGYVLFYKPDFYFENPSHILALWEGGMSFHGGCLGVGLAMFLFARRHAISFLSVTDGVSAVVPVGLFFGRIANFINAELYGRITDVSWGIRFPVSLSSDAVTEPRHPSQLYEAGLEGLLLFILLMFCVRRGALSKTGHITAKFLIGYSVFRSFCEFFREPDTFLGFVIPIGHGGITQGMVLSVPMFLAGLVLLQRKKHI